MEMKLLGVALVALVIGGVGGYVVGERMFVPLGMLHHDEPGLSTGMHHMESDVMGGGDAMMEHMMAMMVESEREFIEGMIPHHQEAIDTAQEVMDRGGSTPDIKQLAQNIIVAQENEIAEMQQWYEDWYGEAYTDTGSYEPMMRELETLSGTALDRVFLEDMIGHHMGAIMMAQSVQPYIEHDEIATLTKAIVTTQSAEIAQMRKLLQGL